LDCRQRAAFAYWFGRRGQEKCALALLVDIFLQVGHQTAESLLAKQILIMVVVP